MDSIQQVRETMTGMAFILLLAGSLFALEARPQSSDTEGVTLSDVNAMQQVPDVAAMEEAADAGAAAPQASGPIHASRRAFLEARRNARFERIRARKQVVPQEEASPPGIVEQTTSREEAAPGKVELLLSRGRVKSPSVEQKLPQEEAAPVEPDVTQKVTDPRSSALADFSVFFKPEARLARDSHMGDAWVSTYSGVQEGELTVEARVQARNGKGQAVDIRPEWTPADPSTVVVSPAEGNAVKITVRGSGESNLTVAGPGFSKDLWISAKYQGSAIEVRISQ